MIGALAWGSLAAFSLVLGSLLAFVRDWDDRQVGLVLAFGAGALISAVSFELAEEGTAVGGGAAVGVGLAAGAVTYYVLDLTLDKAVGSSNAGAGLALGAFLDGIPEQLVLGIGLAAGGSIGVGLLVAIFVSNLPEAIGSAGAMRDAGRPRRTVLYLWLAIAVVCALASALGYGLAAIVSDELQAVIDGFAAGALLVMLIDSMIPEAARKGGRAAGLVTTFGFAVAAGLSTLA